MGAREEHDTSARALLRDKAKKRRLAVLAGWLLTWTRSLRSAVLNLNGRCVSGGLDV
jgi:hypothetical protein